MLLVKKKNPRFKTVEFAKMISNLSKTQVIIMKSTKDIEKYLKRNLISNEIVIGMGAGTLSKYMRELKFLL